MHYPEIRSQLRSGDLLLCSGTSWFSRLTLHRIEPEGPRPELPAGSLEKQAYICSEYVAAAYAELGIEIACISGIASLGKMPITG